MSEGKHDSLKVVLGFGAVFVAWDLFVAGLCLVGVLSLFRSVFLVYYSNFVVFPFLGAGYFVFGLIRKKTGWTSWTILLISVALFGVYVYATHIEPHRLEVNEIEIATDKFDGEVVIAHISDIQSKRVGAYEKKVFEVLRRIGPDIVIHTGDLIQPCRGVDYDEQLEKMAELFGGLKPAHGVFNVVGNVDGLLDAKHFDEMSGARTLVNEEVEIAGNGFALEVLGLSCAQSMRGDRDAIVGWLKGTEGKFTIILGHAPDYVLGMTDCDVDLCLAGHTHGGQVRLPGVGPLLNMSNTPKSWAAGFRRFDGMGLNVSRGIGTERASDLPPIRFNCRPEISVIRIIGRADGGR